MLREIKSRIKIKEQEQPNQVRHLGWSCKCHASTNNSYVQYNSCWCKNKSQRSWSANVIPRDSWAEVEVDSMKMLPLDGALPTTRGACVTMRIPLRVGGGREKTLCHMARAGG